MLEDIGKSLEAFDLATLQSFVTIVTVIDSHGYSIPNVIASIENAKKKYVNTSTIPIKSCPQCSSQMRRYEVNTNNRNQVGDELDYQWL